MRYVYLAGPIMGCTEFEANDWRRAIADRLDAHGITGISPLRCEPLHGATYGIGSPDPRFGTARAIAAKNLFDVQNCDMTLCYLPHRWDDPFGDSREAWPSLGTIGELFWANALGKRTILVTDSERIWEHPVIDAAANWKLRTLAEAVDVLAGVLGGYIPGGKNV